MSAFDDFMIQAEKIGLTQEDFYIEECENGAKIVSYSEEAENDTVDCYDVILTFNESDENLIDICISKEIENIDRFDELDELDLLSKLNELNNNYRGLTFILDEKYVMISSLCGTQGDIKNAIKRTVFMSEIANKEFPNLK